MVQKNLVKIKSIATGNIRYTTRNKKSVEKKLELRKHDPISRKHEIYKETKK